MKKLAMIIAFASMPLISFAAGPESRDDMIKRIENLQMSTSVLPPDSPLLADILKSASKANPDVKKAEWDAIRREASVAISSAMTQPGGLMDVAYRASLESLTDVELSRLEVLLSDPVWQKFTTSMAAPATQQKIVKALVGNSLQMDATMNEVLTKHGLKTIQ
jgi:hypothetical protein